MDNKILEDKFQSAPWIWLAAGEETNQYGCFRYKFNSQMGGKSKLLISSDTDFIVYLNGKEAARGQFPDYEFDKTYSEFIIDNVLAGENVIAVLAYHCGDDFFTHAKSKAGFAVAMDINGEIITSSSAWKGIQNPAFTSGVMAKVTPQLGFVIKYDANKELNWQDCNFDDSGWARAVACKHELRSLTPRPLAPLVIGPGCQSKIIKHGLFKREKELETFAATVERDEYTFTRDLPESIPPDYDGIFLIADMLEEVTGFIELECTASVGAVIDISHGEHLDDGVVRARIDIRNFTDRYICKEGKNLFQFPFRRIGGRFIQLNITNLHGVFALEYLGVKLWNYAVGAAATFETGEPMSQKLRDVGIRTMNLCMHDHYEDCVWREQSLYAYDSRNQMMFGYYVWGNYKFAQTSLDLLGRGIGEDGQLNLCAPTHRTIVIPIFSFVWVTALLENYMYSGDKKLLEKFAPQLEFMIGKICELFNSKYGLFHTGTGPDTWHFYEWVEGLSKYGCNELEFHATYNLYIYEMLKSYSKILDILGDKNKSAVILAKSQFLGAAIEKTFWDETQGNYATFVDNGILLDLRHEHTQYLMMYNKLVPAKNSDRVFQSVSNGKLVGLTFSPLLYMLDGNFSTSCEARRYAVSWIDKAYKVMIDAGATTFWEVGTGGNAFDNAGSLCHAWSSIHTYYYGSKVLGVKPLTAGFKDFEVKVYPAAFKQAGGSIPTPYGMIKIAWHLDADNKIILNVQHPKACTPVIAEYEEFPIQSYISTII